jgi:hypothetical protein
LETAETLKSGGEQSKSSLRTAPKFPKANSSSQSLTGAKEIATMKIATLQTPARNRRALKKASSHLNIASRAAAT